MSKFSFNDDIHDSLSSDGVAAKRRIRRPGNRSDSLLLLACLGILIGLAGVVTFHAIYGQRVLDWMASAVHGTSVGTGEPETLPLVKLVTGIEDPYLARFELGGARFGMTPAMIDEAVQIGWRVSRMDHRVAVYDQEGATFEVWFKDDGNTSEAFRIAYDRTFATYSEQQIFRHLRKRLGPPFDNACGRGLVISEYKCRAQWIHSGGVLIKATTTRAGDGSGSIRVHLNLIAINTLVERPALTPRKDPGPHVATVSPRKESPLATSPIPRREILPFAKVEIPHARLMTREQVQRVRELLK